MSLTLPADAGEPMPMVLVAGRKVARHEFPATTRQISLRNTGTNTLWISFDRRAWIDVACGTSLDDRVIVREMWYCTQLGRTRFVVLGLALMGTDIGVQEQIEEDDRIRVDRKRSRRSTPRRSKRRWLPSRVGKDKR